METTIIGYMLGLDVGTIYWGYIGIMVKKMGTAIGFRVFSSLKDWG